MSKSILIVDDNNSNLKVIINFLSASGKDYTLFGAPDGKTGCLLAKTKKPDLIILDWQMPGMSGIEVLEHLKDDPELKDIPVIMATALTSSDNLKLALEKGAQDYVRKPIDSVELLARIDVALQLSDSFSQIKEKNLLISKQNQDLLVQKESLEKLNTLKDKVFSVISHDLRGPIVGLKALFDLFHEEEGELRAEDFKDFEADMYEAVIEINNLLSNLLKWSMSQFTMGSSYKPGYFNLNEVVNPSINLFKSNLKRKSIEVINLVDTNTNVYADSNMVEFVIRNLLANAIKFSYHNSKIEIGVDKQISGFLVVYVKDFGVGMDEIQKQKLFSNEELFTKTGTDNEKGTGLGLVLAKEYVLKNGGQIFVESIIGKGSTFSFSLPLHANQLYVTK